VDDHRSDNPQDEVLQSMLAEMRRADPIYLPSRFWEFHGGGHLDLMSRRGLESFKRTLNLSYYNWLPRTWDDNQLLNVLASWARRPGGLPLQARLTEPPDVESVHKVPFLQTDEERTIYALYVGLLWDHVLRTDRYGVLASLQEPQIGSPLPVEAGGRCLSQDLPNSVREYNSLRDCLEAGRLWDDRLVLGELGAGYGRLAYVFAKSAPGRYFIFDVPPTLYVSQWYLSQVCPEKRVFAFRPFRHFDEVRSELEQSQLAFFTPNQLELFPADYFTGFISISSLAEMTADQVGRYKQLMGRTAAHLIYLKQWQQHYNAHDKLRLEASQYVLGGDWTVLGSRTDAVQDDFVELFQGKTGSPVGAFRPTDERCVDSSQDAKLQQRQRDLTFYQSAADERLDVIRNLDAACRQRQEEIERLTAAIEEKDHELEMLRGTPKLLRSGRAVLAAIRRRWHSQSR
jgi:putative sugar O-methyltransferase